MRAITCSGYGRPTEVLRLTDVDDPRPGDHDVVVAVRAASLNAADWHLVRGTPYLARLQIGLRRPSFLSPGSDVAGTVVAVGPAVTTVQPGDEVIATTFMAGFGGCAELVVAPEELVVRRPGNATFAESAGLPLAGSTALQAVRDHGRIRPGQRALVIGASGGVGSHAVQIAKHLGATVDAVCSSANVDLVRQLGADEVIDHSTEDVLARPERWDLILQAAGSHRASELRRLLTPGGTLVQISGDSPNRWVGPLPRIVAGRLLSLVVRERIASFTVRPCRSDLELLVHLVEAGALRTRVDRSCTLAEVGVALEQMEAGRTRGKLVVTVADDSAA